MCSERALALYIVGISLGGWQHMYTERLVDSVVGKARDAMTVSCVVRGDPRAGRWRPREGTRAWQSMGPLKGFYISHSRGHFSAHST